MTDTTTPPNPDDALAAAAKPDPAVVAPAPVKVGFADLVAAYRVQQQATADTAAAKAAVDRQSDADLVAVIVAADAQAAQEAYDAQLRQTEVSYSQPGVARTPQGQVYASGCI